MRCSGKALLLQIWARDCGGQAGDQHTAACCKENTTSVKAGTHRCACACAEGGSAAAQAPRAASSVLLCAAPSGTTPAKCLPTACCGVGRTAPATRTLRRAWLYHTPIRAGQNGRCYAAGRGADVRHVTGVAGHAVITTTALQRHAAWRTSAACADSRSAPQPLVGRGSLACSRAGAVARAAASFALQADSLTECHRVHLRCFCARTHLQSSAMAAAARSAALLALALALGVAAAQQCKPAWCGVGLSPMRGSRGAVVGLGPPGRWPGGADSPAASAMPPRGSRLIPHNCPPQRQRWRVHLG